MATETLTKQATKETFHFINDPADAINEAAIGLTEHNTNLSYAAAHKIVYRSDLDTFRKDHVTTIGFAGGGQYDIIFIATWTFNKVYEILLTEWQ